MYICDSMSDNYAKVSLVAYFSKLDFSGVFIKLILSELSTKDIQF